jgi:hypothetical protein
MLFVQQIMFMKSLSQVIKASKAKPVAAKAVFYGLLPVPSIPIIFQIPILRT